ncbi:hypothetical protein B2M27_23240 [Kluyvera intermedia]|uniref:Uncharacterized protein n=1 Tax=Kluyvera intermedia TaxID=61648 RepID=A0ABX3U9A1_KLUIN|nr:hypothetical protein [Kluyvera intermedia]ORJ47999.1 hypothetical protein B2M27_23240 [Kluyvera intermedia]
MDTEKNVSGKIAFIFPAKYNAEGASSPTLNFATRYDGIVAMSVGISFIELAPKTPYFVILKMKGPSDEDVEISSGMDAVPPDQIDPKRHTSFLTASFYFKPEKFGTYRFSCELISPFGNGKPNDIKDVLFNVFDYGK